MGSLILRILIGLVLVAIGAYMVVKTTKFIDFFGHVDYFDQKLGGGGTMIFYKMLGIILCFVGFIVATNMWDAFLEATVGSIFPHG